MPGPRLHDAAPNPFNPQTTIAFELPNEQAVSLRVFDISGRLVRELVAGETMTMGRHETVWNGRDNTGRRVASGTYFYRLEAGEYSETKRMALIK
jgi:flagellar hook assembly protein FlgD